MQAKTPFPTTPQSPMRCTNESGSNKNSHSLSLSQLSRYRTPPKAFAPPCVARPRPAPTHPQISCDRLQIEGRPRALSTTFVQCTKSPLRRTYRNNTLLNFATPSSFIHPFHPAQPATIALPESDSTAVTKGPKHVSRLHPYRSDLFQCLDTQKLHPAEHTHTHSRVPLIIHHTDDDDEKRECHHRQINDTQS